LAAKVSHEINNIPTCENFFFPYLACVSAGYAFFKKINVIALSSHFCAISVVKKQPVQTIFLPHLYSLF
jgi:hypothetical protein